MEGGKKSEKEKKEEKRKGRNNITVCVARGYRYIYTPPLPPLTYCPLLRDDSTARLVDVYCVG